MQSPRGTVARVGLRSYGLELALGNASERIMLRETLLNP
jgi:hypothetical protein